MWYPATYHGHHRQNKGEKTTLRLRRPIPLWTSDAAGFSSPSVCKSKWTNPFYSHHHLQRLGHHLYFFFSTYAFVLLLFPSTFPAENHSVLESVSSMCKNKSSFTVCGKQDRTGPLKPMEQGTRNGGFRLRKGRLQF